MTSWKMLIGYKTELDPNNQQKTLFYQYAGTARWVYNYGLQRNEEEYEKNKSFLNAFTLCKEIVLLKKTKEFSWLKNISKHVPQYALRNLEFAFKMFFNNCKKKAQEKFKGKLGHPKKKTRKNGVGSFTLGDNIYVEKNRIKFPCIGWVKLKEVDYLPICQPKSITISEHAGRWFVSIYQDIEVKNYLKEENQVGVDLGSKELAFRSDGKKHENPRALRKNLKKLKRIQRKVSRRKKGGKNKKKAVKKLGKLHFHIANIRKDALHKITSELTKTKSLIVLEDLNVSGMMKNHKLALSISDVGMYEFRRQLEYKCLLYNCELVFIDRFFPSSKKCSSCGHIKDDLKLSDRTYICEHCGLVIDRDLNAAINILNEGIKIWEKMKLMEEQKLTQENNENLKDVLNLKSTVSSTGTVAKPQTPLEKKALADKKLSAKLFSMN